MNWWWILIIVGGILVCCGIGAIVLYYQSIFKLWDNY